MSRHLTSCKPSKTYEPRRLGNKAIILVFLWILTTFLVIFYPGSRGDHWFLYYVGECVIVLPIAGWLADIYFGRYKVIRHALRFQFVGVIIYGVLLLIEQSNAQFRHLSILKFFAGSLAAIGITGVVANAYMLGVDQLVHSSTKELRSYISWYSWTFFLAATIITFSTTCLCDNSSQTVSYLILPVACSLSIVSDSLLNHWLVKEPVTNNPFKLIYQVLRYTVKNKYPRLRSAFTYWEDKPYTRIDLGKTKYGGPFTTEQVEDVKTFFRILVAIIPFSLLSCLIAILYTTNLKLLELNQDHKFLKYCHQPDHLRNCFESRAVLNVSILTPMILTPALQLLIYPLLSCDFKLDILKKLVTGIALLLVFQIILLTIEIVGHNVKKNVNVTCILIASGEAAFTNPTIKLDYKWLIIPNTIFGIAIYTTSTSMMEFICAQAPYSMRGLLFGVMVYACFIPVPLTKTFLELISLAVNEVATENCGVWLYAALIMLTVVFIGIGVCLKKNYTPRVRDENLQNEHMFAENYYDKYLPS